MTVPGRRSDGAAGERAATAPDPAGTADATRLPLWQSLPMHVVNGLSVAFGVALIQTLIGALAGPVPGLVALSGAICASLPDTPLVPRRTAGRVALGGLLGVLATALVIGLHGHTAWGLGAAIVGIAFVSSYLLAWGARAGALSFVGVLALVFAMASPPVAGWPEAFEHAGWTLLGAACYLVWAVGASMALQPVYRRLSLVAVLETLAAMLQSRVGSQGEPDGSAAGGAHAGRQERALRDWVRLEAVLNDRIQAARDLLFERPPRDVEHERQVALLLLAIDLRDTVLAAELDLGLIGDGPDAAGVQAAIGVHGRALAERLGALARAVRARRAPEAVALEVPALGLPAGHPAAALAPVLRNRLRHISDDVARATALLRDEGTEPPASQALLSLFISTESWSPTLLRAQWSGGSPVLRHAVRLALALGSAYALGLALPWTSHPHWLVLSVAVVLRGTLEQTLARRNQRVSGTVLGCAAVLGLSLLGWPALNAWVLVIAVGVAHAYVNVRYLATATAATVMALLQAHLAHPAGGFAIGERLADTLLGAALAWAFCFVLPSWERKGARRAVERLVRALEALSAEVLRWPDGAGEPGPRSRLGLARREAYDSLAALAALAQRTRVEPASVRLPLRGLVDLLGHGQQLLAHLSALRLLLTRRRTELSEAEVSRVLQVTAAQVRESLGQPATERTAETPAAPSAAADDRARSSAAGPADDPLALPAADAEAPLLRWFERRARLATVSAEAVARAAAPWRAAR